TTGRVGFRSVDHLVCGFGGTFVCDWGHGSLFGLSKGGMLKGAALEGRRTQARRTFVRSIKRPERGVANEPLQAATGTSQSAERRGESRTSALLAHDAAFDEHHDQAPVLLIVAEAISAGHCQRLTLFEGLAVSCFHIVHHVPHVPVLSDSGAADSNG